MTTSLWSLRVGQVGEITSYDDALAEKYRIRLMEFGFHVGERVKCLQAPALGAPRVYQVSNTVFSLDDEVASHIMVRVEAADG